MRRILVAVTLVVGLSAGLHAGGHGATKSRPEMLVSADWLAQHLNDPDLVVLHVGSTPDEYEKIGHIPGARFLDTRKITTSEPPGWELAPLEQLKSAFEAVGVNDKTRVVLYTSEWQPVATRAWYTLVYMGHGDHVSLLNGGIEQWLREGRPLTKESPGIKAGELTVQEYPRARGMLSEVHQMAQDEAAVLIDARPRRRYRVGHIPGARSLFWENLLVSDTEPVLKPEAELRKLFAAAGLKPGGKAMVYCELGIQASFVYFVATYLGLEAQNYDGSFSEWWGLKKGELVLGDARYTVQRRAAGAERTEAVTQGH